MIRRVRLLRAGRCLVDRSILEAGAPRGERVDTPIWMTLVESEDALILVDTGMPEGSIQNPGYFEGTEDEGLILPQTTAGDTAAAALARVGLAVSDIDAVVSTHWHFDHAGGNRSFPSTPILVHPEEIAAAGSGGYRPECIDPTLTYRTVGDGEVPLPGLTLLHTPGHTPGHLSLFLELQQGPPLLLTVDAVYVAASWRTGEPGGGRDKGVMRQSMARLKEVARTTGARVFFGHDGEQARSEAWLPLMA